MPIGYAYVISKKDSSVSMPTPNPFAFSSLDPASEPTIRKSSFGETELRTSPPFASIKACISSRPIDSNEPVTQKDFPSRRPQMALDAIFGRTSSNSLATGSALSEK